MAVLCSTADIGVFASRHSRIFCTNSSSPSAIKNSSISMRYIVLISMGKKISPGWQPRPANFQRQSHGIPAHFQRSQCPLTQLCFVKYEQDFLPNDYLPRKMWKDWDQIIRFNAFRKSIYQLWIGFKVKICHIFIVLAPEFQDGISLADLPCPCRINGLRYGLPFRSLKNSWTLRYI